MNKTDNIKVAVWMVTYNHEKFIQKAICSVVTQKTNFKIKLFIGEDCSSDNTRNICIELKQKYKDKIELILQENNVGSSKNAFDVYRACIKSGADYIAMCEGDDYWIDDYKLQKQVDYLDENKDYVLTGHNAKIIDAEENVIQNLKLPQDLCRDASISELKQGFWALTLSMVFRNVIKQDLLKLFEKKKFEFTDTFLISYLGQFGKYHYLSEVEPAAYRKHSQGIWSMKTEAFRNIKRLSILYNIADYYYKKDDPIVDKLFMNVFNKIKQVKKSNFYSQLKINDKIKYHYMEIMSYFRMYGISRTIHFLILKPIR